ncbi:uncharacterized protein EMH_0051880 [Eimeria mitis]|uniref:Protein kinase domain-containing protein n=1 Tax=Eimeria mitis TaxID=44415 RepID=U6JY54_9EIME|nr:uncharacterized protein EMH_0051880 [Eimeria mitis]CDJ29696.1 hypothetical protein EMH_0051880 [Eimeria mitis]
MWSLGVLLFQLYTGEDHPYGKVEGPDWAEQAESLSQQLLRDGTRSDILIPKLDAAEVPERWAELILRLLEPQRAHRIGAFQVIKEFPDLIKNTAAE